MADRERWGDPLSYKDHWSKRAEQAATLIPNDVSVLEIGAGTGSFRQLIGHRTRYQGMDLQPLHPSILPLDLDNDPLPDHAFDFVVILGVFEYLHHSDAAATKICAAAGQIVISYCCKRDGVIDESFLKARHDRGWVNSFTLMEFANLFMAHGFQLTRKIVLNAPPDFEEYLLLFGKK
jgi:hypothetical protein